MKKIGGMDMYKIELKAKEKIFLIAIEGLATEKEIISYVNDLKMNIMKINPAEYYAVADLRKLITSPQNFTMLMEQSIKLIADTPFKKRYSIMPASATASMQLKRVGNQADKFIFIESYEKVLQSIA